MNEIRYIISDASKRVDVEPHVLRYWEEELNLNIPRNEMGHRYYREQDINTFKAIKILKEQGFQLRAIKMVLPDISNIETLDPQSILKLRRELNERTSLLDDMDLVADHTHKVTNITDRKPLSTTVSSNHSVTASQSDDKMIQFRTILQGIVYDALKENNKSLSNSVSTTVSENIVKEIDYLFREREDRDEDRFRQLDETIRSYQKTRQEVAASEMAKEKKKKKGLFSKKKGSEN